jgi:ubiquitin-like modifier-activating enzyme 5
MGIVAGFLVQSTLKILLRFGKVTFFLGYSALSDYFSKYPMNPNTECTDRRCVEL